MRCVKVHALRDRSHAEVHDAVGRRQAAVVHTRLGDGAHRQALYLGRREDAELDGTDELPRQACQERIRRLHRAQSTNYWKPMFEPSYLA